MIGISIERGIPMPIRWAAHFKYPWLELKAGDSFLWPASLQSAWRACRQRKRRHGELYRVAKVTEDGKHLIRIWKLAHLEQGEAA